MIETVCWLFGIIGAGAFAINLFPQLINGFFYFIHLLFQVI